MIAYLGAFMTAIYTFRMIFRAFHGEPCEEAEELSHGHLYHPPEPTNPMTGEVEDTEVGFPGPDHHIAEQEAPMKVAMGALAVLTIIGGFLQIPGVSSELHHFLEPTFHDSELYETLEPSVAQEWIGLLIGAVIGITGIGIAWRIYGHGGKAGGDPGAVRRAAQALREQVVLRRGDRLPDRPPDGLARPLLRDARSSACSSTAP